MVFLLKIVCAKRYKKVLKDNWFSPIYTKLELEKMNTGELLEIILDFPASVKNVPDNCKRQGIGELLDVKTFDDKKEWILLIKKI